MSKDKEQKIMNEAHTISIDLTDAAGGKIVIMRNKDGTVSIAHRDILLGDWPAPIAFTAGRILMHMALQIDPSLKGKL